MSLSVTIGAKWHSMFSSGQNGTQCYHWDDLARGDLARGDLARGEMGKGESGRHQAVGGVKSLAFCMYAL